MNRRATVGIIIGLCVALSHAMASAADPADWSAVESAAKGQTVYWHAWGGDPNVNAYKSWVGDQVKARFGVTLEHVKLADTADAVNRVAAEKAAGNNANGAVDLIWINGENFASMKRNSLLFGPWAEKLPNFALTGPDTNPSVREDFTVPTEGYESPYGAAQLVFMYDSATVAAPPRTLRGISNWAAANPGRFTYAAPPDFLGATFLKQALLEIVKDRTPLYAAVDAAEFDAMSEPLWAYLDALHPHLWRRGRTFAQTGVALRTLLGDGEIDIAYTFDPGAAAAGVSNGRLPPSTRSYVLDGGSIGNANFVAIPFNASAKEGAMVVANFLLSVEAQARKADPAYWGGATVLDMKVLSDAERAMFDALDLGEASLKPSELGPILPEPHPSWMVALEAEWLKRYGAQ